MLRMIKKETTIAGTVMTVVCSLIALFIAFAVVAHINEGRAIKELETRVAAAVDSGNTFYYGGDNNRLNEINTGKVKPILEFIDKESGKLVECYVDKNGGIVKLVTDTNRESYFPVFMNGIKPDTFMYYEGIEAEKALLRK